MSYAEPLRVMIVGDSLSHGADGDWTWRFRIWQWTQANKIDMQFVGPYNDTSSNEPPGAYNPGVDAEFLQNCFHYAKWGWAALQASWDVAKVVEEYQPDLMLVMLGHNDIAWLNNDGPAALGSIGNIVTNSRRARPKLKFAIASAPLRLDQGETFRYIETNTLEFNHLLPPAIAEWSTPESPVRLVDLANTYECRPWACPAGYDGLHPNPYGEFQIANAFTSALVAEFGLGSEPLPVPDRHSIPGFTPTTAPVPTRTWFYAPTHSPDQKSLTSTQISSSTTSSASPATSTIAVRPSPIESAAPSFPSEKAIVGLSIAALVTLTLCVVLCGYFYFVKRRLPSKDYELVPVHHEEAVDEYKDPNSDEEDGDR